MVIEMPRPGRGRRDRSLRALSCAPSFVPFIGNQRGDGSGDAQFEHQGVLGGLVVVLQYSKQWRPTCRIYKLVQALKQLELLNCYKAGGRFDLTAAKWSRVMHFSRIRRMLIAARR